jgi:hypothetical protein
MKILLAAGIFVCLAASAVFGQAGSIGIFANPAATDCGLVARSQGIALYYVVHVNTPGAKGCQYWAPKPSCFVGMWLADSNVFPVTLGNSQTGVSAGYGSCRTAPILVQTIQYFVTGATPNCCCYYIYPHPQTEPPGLWVVDCADNLLEASAGMGIINTSAGSCGCYPCFSPECLQARAASTMCINAPVPVKATTWGRLKSLYSE